MTPGLQKRHPQHDQIYHSRKTLRYCRKLFYLLGKKTPPQQNKKTCLTLEWKYIVCKKQGTRLSTARRVYLVQREPINQLFEVLKKAKTFAFFFSCKIHILLPLFKGHAIWLVCTQTKLLHTEMLYQTLSENKYPSPLTLGVGTLLFHNNTY